MRYQAILFASDGEFITDFKNKKSINEVWDCINNMGSKWIFYPFCCVTTDKGCLSKNQRIVSSFDLVNNEVKNKSIKKASEYFKYNSDILFKCI